MDKESLKITLVNNGERKFPENIYLAESFRRCGHKVSLIGNYNNDDSDLLLLTVPQSRNENSKSQLWKEIANISHKNKAVVVHGDFKSIRDSYPTDTLIFKTNFSGGYSSNVIPLPKTPLSWACSNNFYLMDKPVATTNSNTILFVIGSQWSGSRLKLSRILLEHSHIFSSFGYILEVVTSLPLEQYFSIIDQALLSICCNGNIETEPDEGDDWKVGESLMRGTPVIKCSNGVRSNIDDFRAYDEFSWGGNICGEILNFANKCYRNKVSVKNKFDSIYGFSAMANYIIGEALKFNGN